MVKKRARELPALNATLIPPAPKDRVLELDELWSFVYSKAFQCWVWIALCAGTKQVVAFVTGDRSARTCQRLWRAVPWRYKRALCYSDFWEAYSSVIPSDQHEAVGKESGKTNHVERWNNTLRQRVGRFVRKSLSFSKCWEMHEACLALFVHRYNRERANIILN
jgi:insertion element IS1 protein InsB